MHTKKIPQDKQPKPRARNKIRDCFSYLYHLQINIDKLEEGGGKEKEEGPSIHERRLRRRKSPQRKIQKKTKDL